MVSESRINETLLHYRRSFLLCDKHNLKFGFAMINSHMFNLARTALLIPTSFTDI